MDSSAAYCVCAVLQSCKTKSGDRRAGKNTLILNSWGEKMYLKINPTVSSPSHSPPSTSTRVGCCLERTVMITNKSKKKNRKLKKKNGAVIELNGTCKLIVPKTRKAGISYQTICSFLIAVIAIKEQQARPILDRRPCSNSCISF